jgi:hypothetical protein
MHYAFRDKKLERYPGNAYKQKTVNSLQKNPGLIQGLRIVSNTYVLYLLWTYWPILICRKNLDDPASVPLDHGLVKGEPLRANLPRVGRHFSSAHMYRIQYMHSLVHTHVYFMRNLVHAYASMGLSQETRGWPRAVENSVAIFFLVFF